MTTSTRPTLTLRNKRVPRLVERRKSFYLKRGKDTLFVDRGGYVYERGHNGVYRRNVGHIKKMLEVVA